MRTRLLSSLLLTLVLGAHAAWAQQGTIELKNVVEVEVQTKTPDGKVERTRAPVQTAVPGSEIVYTTTYRNVGTKPAAKISVRNAIPSSTTLVAGSPWGQGVDIYYSADGGKTWATADKVTLKDPATGKERPAGLTELTDIRWVVRGDLAPGKQGEVGFRVIVN